MDQRLGNWELSLDQPIGEDQDGSSTRCPAVPARPARRAARRRSVARRCFARNWRNLPRPSDERDEDILRNRLLSETPLTLDDLGAKYGITKERTRQLEARIIKRLRDYMKKDVKDFDRLTNLIFFPHLFTGNIGQSDTLRCPLPYGAGRKQNFFPAP